MGTDGWIKLGRGGGGHCSQNILEGQEWSLELGNACAEEQRNCLMNYFIAKLFAILQVELCDLVALDWKHNIWILRAIYFTCRIYVTCRTNDLGRVTTVDETGRFARTFDIKNFWWYTLLFDFCLKDNSLSTCNHFWSGEQIPKIFTTLTVQMWEKYWKREKYKIK